MKKLNPLKLNQLGKAEIEKRELNALKGGVCGCLCSCGCLYAGEEGDNCEVIDDYYGGSSTEENNIANAYQNATNTN